MYPMHHQEPCHHKAERHQSSHILHTRLPEVEKGSQTEHFKQAMGTNTFRSEKHTEIPLNLAE